MKKILALLAVVGAVSSPAYAFDWGACKAEIDKFCPGEKDDEKIWSCLQKHDIDLSKECDNNAHSKYEEATGKKK